MKSILYVRQGLNGKDEVLIDPHTLSADHTTDLGLLDVSSNGKLIVYSICRRGQDETELRVMDVDKRKDVDQRDEGASTSSAEDDCAPTSREHVRQACFVALRH